MCRSRPIEHKGKIGPALGIGCWTEVFIGQIAPACEYPRLVEDGDLAMVAQVASVEQCYAPDRQEERGLGSRAFELPQETPWHVKRSETIDQKSHFDAGSCTRDEAINDCLPGLIPLQLIGLNRD